MNDSQFSTSITLLCSMDDLQDQAAWDRFVEQYSPLIFFWCRKFGVQESDAPDVTQEVLLRLLEKLQGFSYDPARGSFRAWLKTVTVNLIRDFQRRVERRKEIPFGSESQVLNTLNAVQDPAAYDQLAILIQQQYEVELLTIARRNVRAKVQPNTWQAYSLYAEENLPAAEVASQVAMPVAEVYVAKSRVLKMLGKEVEKLDGGDDPARVKR